jgi:hypothetical protein
MENYEYRSDIRQVIEQIMQSMLARYCRTYVVRLDIRFPQGYVPMHANEECSELMRLLKEYYTYHKIITQYVVVREQNLSEKPHYHVVILFDGSKVENGWEVCKKADGIWQRRVGSDVKSCVHLCRRFDGSNGIMIVRPTTKAVGLDLQNQLTEFNVAYDEAMTWLDYLAKTATKGHAPPKTKEWFSSHLWS